MPADSQIPEGVEETTENEYTEQHQLQSSHSQQQQQQPPAPPSKRRRFTGMLNHQQRSQEQHPEEGESNRASDASSESRGLSYDDEPEPASKVCPLQSKTISSLWEGEYIVKDAIQKLKAAATSLTSIDEYSPVLLVPFSGEGESEPQSFLRCRLFVRLRQDGIGGFVEILGPIVREPFLDTGIDPDAEEELQLAYDADADSKRWAEWSVPDAVFYISILNLHDWTQSIHFDSHFTFKKAAVQRGADRDRGWEYMVDLRRVTSTTAALDPHISPAGHMTFRYGVRAKGIQLDKGQGGPWRGLRNHGTTCYLNSLLQCLFHLGCFRNCIYEVTHKEDSLLLSNDGAGDDDPGNVNPNDDPVLLLKLRKELEAHEDADTTSQDSFTEEEINDAFDTTHDMRAVVDGKIIDLSDSCSIERALQKVFYQLSKPDQRNVVDCLDLINSFGWGEEDRFTQHDAQELNRILCDHLESRMKSTKTEGTIKELFGGESEMFIECIDVDYKSKRMEVFYDLQLDVKGLESLEASLDQYTKPEILDGDNCYFAEQHGRQRASKGVRFLSCPPILQFHLKRFTFDMMSMAMVKVNDRFTFPDVLDMEKWCPGAGVYEIFAIDVHHGELHSGHYYTFLRSLMPDGRRAWFKFDDECVTRVDHYAAVNMNFGGPLEEVSTMYRSGSDMSRNRRMSAYILFYIHKESAQKVLNVPALEKVNPGLITRFEIQQKLRRRKMQIRETINNQIKVTLVSEEQMITSGECNYPWRKMSQFKAIKGAVTLNKMINEPVDALWRTTVDLCAEGKFGRELMAPKTLPGLYYLCQDINKGVPLIYVWPVEFATQVSPAASDRFKAASLLYNYRYSFSSSENEKRAKELLLMVVPIPSGSATPEGDEIRDIHDCTRAMPIKIFDRHVGKLFFFGFVIHQTPESKLTALPASTAGLEDSGNALVTAKILDSWRKYRDFYKDQGMSSGLANLLCKLASSKAVSFVTESERIDSWSQPIEGHRIMLSTMKSSSPSSPCFLISPTVDAAITTVEEEEDLKLLLNLMRSKLLAADTPYDCPSVRVRCGTASVCWNLCATLKKSKPVLTDNEYAIVNRLLGTSECRNKAALSTPSLFLKYHSNIRQLQVYLYSINQVLTNSCSWTQPLQPMSSALSSKKSIDTNQESRRTDSNYDEKTDELFRAETIWIRTDWNVEALFGCIAAKFRGLFPLHCIWLHGCHPSVWFDGSPSASSAAHSQPIALSSLTPTSRVTSALTHLCGRAIDQQGQTEELLRYYGHASEKSNPIQLAVVPFPFTISRDDWIGVVSMVDGGDVIATAMIKIRVEYSSQPISFVIEVLLKALASELTNLKQKLSPERYALWEDQIGRGCSQGVDMIVEIPNCPGEYRRLDHNNDCVTLLQSQYSFLQSKHLARSRIQLIPKIDNTHNLLDILPIDSEGQVYPERLITVPIQIDERIEEAIYRLPADLQSHSISGLYSKKPKEKANSKIKIMKDERFVDLGQSRRTGDDSATIYPLQLLIESNCMLQRSDPPIEEGPSSSSSTVRSQHQKKRRQQPTLSFK